MKKNRQLQALMVPHNNEVLNIECTYLSDARRYSSDHAAKIVLLGADNKVLDTFIEWDIWPKFPHGLVEEARRNGKDVDVSASGRTMSGKVLTFTLEEAHSVANIYNKEASAKAVGMMQLLKDPESILKCPDPVKKLESMGLDGSDVFRLGMKKRNRTLIQISNRTKMHGMQIEVSNGKNGFNVIPNFKENWDLLTDLTCEPMVPVLFLFKNRNDLLEQYCRNLEPSQWKNTCQVIERHGRQSRSSDWMQKLARYTPAEVVHIKEPLTDVDRKQLATLASSRMSPLTAADDSVLGALLRAGADKPIVLSSALQHGNKNWCRALLPDCPGLVESKLRDQLTSTTSWTAQGLEISLEYLSGQPNYGERLVSIFQGDNSKLDAERLKVLFNLTPIGWTLEPAVTKLFESTPDKVKLVYEQYRLRDAQKVASLVPAPPREAMEVQIELA